MDKKYTLTLTEKQIIVIKEALEEYFRIRMNQWDNLADELTLKNIDISRDNPNHKIVFENYIHTRDAIREIFKCVGRILDYEYNNPKSENQLVAEDIWQVIRHQLWKDSENNNDWCVDAREPLKMSEEPLPEIKRVGEKL